jgi:hypothetical protein
VTGSSRFSSTHLLTPTLKLHAPLSRHGFPARRGLIAFAGASQFATTAPRTSHGSPGHYGHRTRARLCAQKPGTTERGFVAFLQVPSQTVHAAGLELPAVAENQRVERLESVPCVLNKCEPENGWASAEANPEIMAKSDQLLFFPLHATNRILLPFAAWSNPASVVSLPSNFLTVTCRIIPMLRSTYCSLSP